MTVAGNACSLPPRDVCRHSFCDIIDLNSHEFVSTPAALAPARYHARSLGNSPHAQPTRRFSFLFAWLTRAIAGVLVAAPFSVTATAQDTPLGIASDVELTDEDQPATPKRYRGREIAVTMHYTGAEWLMRDSRTARGRLRAVAQSARFEGRTSRVRHGLRQRVLRVQLRGSSATKGACWRSTFSPKCCTCSNSAKESQITNIDLIHGTQIDPKLPAGGVDLILLVDVYHEFSRPEAMLKAMRRALRPKGRMALAEFRLEDPNVPIKLLHKMTKKQILKEFEPNGFKLVEQYDKLPWQHLMFFERDDAP